MRVLVISIIAHFMFVYFEWVQTCLSSVICTARGG